jgi:hypothetical protein
MSMIKVFKKIRNISLKITQFLQVIRKKRTTGKVIMTRNELIIILKDLVAKSERYGENTYRTEGSPDSWHITADESILEYLNDQEITYLFDKIEKWYN